METLLEDYKRKLKTVIEMLNADTITPETIQRLTVKKGMLASFIVDIERAMADSTNENSGLHLQRVTHRFITSIAEQYDIEPSKIVIGSQYGTLVVQKYDEGAADKWETLSLIDPNGG